MASWNILVPPPTPLPPFPLPFLYYVTYERFRDQRKRPFTSLPFLLSAPIHQQILKEAAVPFCCLFSDLESDISEKEKGSKQDSGTHVFSQVNWDLKSVLLIQFLMDPHYFTAPLFEVHGSASGSMY